MPKVHQVIYASAATDIFVASKLGELLAQARTNNSQQDLTGMLVYNAGSFIQALEGQETDVEGLYARILEDPRHCKHRLLFRGTIAEREFADWSMAFVNVRRVSASAGFVDYQSELAQALVDGSQAKRVLKRFVDGAWRQAAALA